MPTARKTQLEKDAFSSRLILALDKRHVDHSTVNKFVQAFSGNTRVKCSYAAAAMWLGGKGVPYKRTVELLADWLQVTVDWLLTGHVVAPTIEAAAPRIVHGLLTSKVEVSIETLNVARILETFPQKDREMIERLVVTMAATKRN